MEAQLLKEVCFEKWETSVVIQAGTIVTVEPECYVGRYNQDAFTIFPDEYVLLKGSPHVRRRQLRLVETSREPV